MAPPVARQFDHGRERLAKSREQRTKELTKPSAVRAAWGAINGKYKDLNAPIFLKIGNIAARAKDYDDATKDFLDAIKKKNDDAAKIYNEVKKQWGSGSDKIDGLIKEITDTRDDAEAGRKLAGGDGPEDWLEMVDENVKTAENLISERQSIVDNLMKAYKTRLQQLSDGQDKLQKTIDTANAAMDKANKDIDSAEQDIRKFVRGYYTTALDMDKKEMADAVNKLIGEFGK
jgi:chromosome segregation ATPase